MTPEQKARQEIDRQLVQCGWQVQDDRQMNILANRGVAVREFPLSTGEADYMLYADAKAIGVIEAKPEDHSLIGVEPQSDKYTFGPAGQPAALPPAAAVRLRVHRHRDPLHQWAGSLSPQPRSFHLPPPRRTDPAGDTRKPTPGKPGELAGTHHRWPLEGASPAIGNLEESAWPNRRGL